MSFLANDKCLLCGSASVKGVLSLTHTPPANALEHTGVLEGGVVGKTASTPVYPLDLLLCAECGHLQLGVSVDPEVLFRNYTYVSPPGMLNHWRLHAAQCIPRFGLKHGDLVAEIGSNSGDLLDEYQRSGMRVFGFEPATGIAEAANARGVRTSATFFGARTVLSDWYGKAKLVLANNVFAHVRDLRDIVEGVKSILAPDGVFIFEVHWRGSLVEQADIGSVYHEHMHYHAVGSLRKFLGSCGLDLFDVQMIDTHNGSIRCFAHRQGPDDTPKQYAVNDLVTREMEMGLFETMTYADLHVRVERARYDFRQLFDSLVWGPINSGGTVPTVAVLGCSAKLTTLAHHFGLGLHEVQYVCDDAPTKIGKLTPGKRWPIRPFTALVEDPVGICLIGSWNYTEQLVQRAKALCKSQGVAVPVFLTPYPTPKVIS